MKMKTIGGAYTTDGLRLMSAPVTVRFTSDGLGETLRGVVLLRRTVVKAAAYDARAS